MITSASNVQVKRIIGLLGRAKNRCKEQVYVVEGSKMVLEAPKNLVEKIYISQAYEAQHADFYNVVGVEASRVEVVSDSVFHQMSDTKTPQGIMAIVKMQQYSEHDILGGENAFVMVLEDIQDPGNLGTILRTGEGAGISGVIMSRNTVDIYNPKTIRSTMGSLYRVPFLYTDNLAETIGTMKALGIKTYAMHLNGQNTYAQKDYRGKCAFFIGNEGNGLKAETAALADELMRIPMEGSVESLNAAISSAIIMYEVNRQRQEKA